MNNNIPNIIYLKYFNKNLLIELIILFPIKNTYSDNYKSAIRIKTNIIYKLAFIIELLLILSVHSFLHQ